MDHPTDDPQRPAPSRRDFVKAGLAAAALPLLGGVAGCAGGQPVPVLAPPAAPAPAPGPAAGGEREPPDPVADALAEAVRARYGSRLGADEMEKVRGAIRGNLRAAKALRDFELPIATEPAFVFRPYRGAAR